METLETIRAGLERITLDLIMSCFQDGRCLALYAREQATEKGWAFHFCCRDGAIRGLLSSLTGRQMPEEKSDAACFM